MRGAIYCIISPSGKMYIGSAVDYKKRWRDHAYELRRGTHHSKKLQNAWNKYGSLKYEILEYVIEQSKLLEREQYYIDFHDTFVSGYNMTPDSRSGYGRSHSNETKELLRQINLQPSVRAAHSARHKGKVVSAETREKQAAAKRGRQHSEETKAKMRESRLRNLGRL